MSRLGPPAAVFLAALFVFGALFLRFPVLYDGDSYFHLAAAHLYSEGVPDGLPWARFSVMHDGWGDKELLFHVALLPFSLAPDAAVGGRLALACLNAVLLTLLSGLGWRAVGRWGLVAGPIAYLLQADFLNRGFRLRPELLAVTLLVLLTYLAGRRRYLALALVAVAFALSHTAAHVAVGLALLWAAWDRVACGRWNVRLPVAVAGGVAAGMLVHPQFPKNLEIWWIQNVRFFDMKHSLDVGEEIFAPGLADVVLANAPFALGLAALWLAARDRDTAESDESTAAYFTIAAAVFLVLYLMMARMVTWLVPLTVMAVVFQIGRRGWKPRTGFTIGGRRVPLALALLVSLLMAVPRHADPFLVDTLRNAPSIRNEAELKAFGERVPPSARVAATWRDAELYSFYAPQATYLNVLDPIFMAIPYPEQFDAQRALFLGDVPDVPVLLKSVLDSDMIAFDLAEVPPVLVARIDRDPRFQILHRERNLIALVRPSDSFIVEWATPAGDAWPRAVEDHLRAVEGYVDLLRLGVYEGCATLTHQLTLQSPELWTMNFAPWGTGYLEIDGQRTGGVGIPARAVLGEGARVRADLGSGTHQIDVTTCAHDGRIGFYLRRE